MALNIIANPITDEHRKGYIKSFLKNFNDGVCAYGSTTRDIECIMGQSLIQTEYQELCMKLNINDDPEGNCTSDKVNELLEIADEVGVKINKHMLECIKKACTVLDYHKDDIV